VSTDPQRLDDVKVGILCYLHLWAALHKHVNLPHRDIAADIGLWDDQQGSYFAAYNQGNRRLLQINVSYVCALGDEGPTVGQLAKIPPCTPVAIAPDILILLNALAEGEGKNTDTALKQIEMIAMMIEKTMPAQKKRASLN
jgi:hypothetical protein